MDESVPAPLVPAHVCEESLGVSVIVLALSLVNVLPNLSCTFTTGFVVKFTLVVAVADGCVVNERIFFAPAISVRVPRLVTPFVRPAIFALPASVIFTLVASGVPAVGRT